MNEPNKEKISWNFMMGLAAGHAVKHFYQQAFLLLIPSFKNTMRLNDVQVGLFGTARTISSSTMNIPAGIMADLWRNKVGFLLAGSLICLALGYLLIGLTSLYWVVLIGVAITGIGTSLWHAPAFGTLGAMYPNKRATALAIHRFGGSIGDSISPIVMGVILSGIALGNIEWEGLSWRSAALILVIPATLSALAVLFFYGKTIGVEKVKNNIRISEYVITVKSLFRNATILSMVSLSSVRAMAHNGLNIFLVLHMSETLNFSEFKIGYHMALLTAFGIISGPLLGLLSDKIGRRIIISIGLSSISLMVFLLLLFNEGFGFAAILACLGIFLYSINPIMLATALDATPIGAEASTTAMMFTGPAIFGALSPIIAGYIRETYGMNAVFTYIGIIVAFVALCSLIVPIRKTN